MLLGYYTTALLTTVVGNIIPAYRTFKALRIDKETETSEEATRWLQYWIIFALFATFEYLVDTVGAYFPLFYELKLGFLLWLTLDRFKGAAVVYTRFLEPALASKEKDIDGQVAFMVDRAQNLQVEDMRTFVDWASAKSSEIANVAGKPAPAKTVEQSDKPASDEDEPVEVEPKKEQ